VAATGAAPSLRVRGRAGVARTVWLPQPVGALLRAFIQRHRRAFMPPNVAPDDGGQPLVFNERRRRFERTGLYRRVVRILSEAGLAQRASVQVLRHTYAYLAYLRTGGNLLFVQRQLGHAHPMITALYAHLVPESYADLADRVGRAPRRAGSPGAAAGSNRVVSK
jgi:site-specific recombinase XerD